MSRFLSYLQTRQDLFLVGLLMMTILVMIIPLPTWVIDLLIAANISLTLLVLIVAVYLKRPDDFTAFPAIILLATTFRLAITISTTRLILSYADAGAIIDTFGHFVTSGSVVVGLVIFLIITTVQFVVVTKGSERVAEVAARFNLDGLPGRQMSIDSELRSGDITPNQAQAKRAQLEKENQFFGAMDGAMKFVKGDAIAGLIIVAINLLGGMAVGMAIQKMDAGAAVNVYSRLTVGDGLVSQIPALIIAMCAGTIITRVNNGGGSDLGTDMVQQLIANPRSMFLAAFLVTVIGLIPGFPTMIFLAIAITLAATGFFMAKREKAELEEINLSASDSAAITGADGSDENILGRLSPKKIAAENETRAGDAIAIALGPNLYNTLDQRELVRFRHENRQKLLNRFGIPVPSYGIYEDREHGANEFTIVLDTVAGFSAQIPDDVIVAQCDPDLLTLNNLPIAPLDRVWRLRSAFWVPASAREVLETSDIHVMSIEELIENTAALFIRHNMAKMLGYQDIQQLIRDLAGEHENLATQIGQSITAVQLMAVIRRLIEEDVPLLPRRILFEALLEATVAGGSTSHFVTQARRALSRQICASICDENQLIAGHIVEPQLEIHLRECIAYNGEDAFLNMPAGTENLIIETVRQALDKTELGSADPVLLTASDLREPLRDFLDAKHMKMTVLAFEEISSEFRFHVIGTIGNGQATGGERNMAA